MVGEAASWRREFPFRSRWLTVPGLAAPENQLHYLDEGKGEAVVCLHGNPTWSFYYRTVMQRLRSDYRVIAYDHLGCGLSGRPADFSYRVVDHQHILDVVITQLGLSSVHLVLHDWGGPIGLGWAVRQPERVKSLVITDTAVFNEDDVPKRIAFLTMPILGEFLIRRANVFARAALWMASARGLTAEQRAGLLYPYGSYQQRLGIARFVQDIPRTPHHPSAGEIKEIARLLPKIRCKKLLLWGMKDFCFHPGFLAKWQEIYPEARVVTYADAGHYLFEDEGEATAEEVLNFLKDPL